MQLKNIKRTITTGWVVTVGAAGLVAGVTGPLGWLALAGAAIVPPLAMMRYWHDPEPTMSERIHDALR